MSTVYGPLVIAYTHQGREYQSGGWAGCDAAALVPDLEADGCAGIGVYDGIAAARARFPAGTRVQAPGKYWKSQLGTVEAGHDGGAWFCTRSGAEVRVRFDDGWVTTWQARLLQVSAPAAQGETTVPDAGPPAVLVLPLLSAHGPGGPRAGHPG